jgi:hypothetical protein
MVAGIRQQQAFVPDTPSIRLEMSLLIGSNTSLHQFQDKARMLFQQQSPLMRKLKTIADDHTGVEVESQLFAQRFLFLRLILASPKLSNAPGDIRVVTFRI